MQNLVQNLLKYLRIIPSFRPRRYRNLREIILAEGSRSIIEIGVYQGTRARQMIETAGRNHPAHQIDYYGFDLFEGLTDSMKLQEFSKRPPASDVLKRQLQNTGANIQIYEGFTRDTLPKFVKEMEEQKKTFDFIFIDGGHSIETIALDWDNMKRLMMDTTVVVFDDYYNNDEDAIYGLGCQTLINDLDREIYDVKLLPPEDYFLKRWGLLKVQMVEVRLTKKQSDIATNDS